MALDEYRYDLSPGPAQFRGFIMFLDGGAIPIYETLILSYVKIFAIERIGSHLLRFSLFLC
jgi:hypothetical protein